MGNISKDDISAWPIEIIKSCIAAIHDTSLGKLGSEGRKKSKMIIEVKFENFFYAHFQQ